VCWARLKAAGAVGLEPCHDGYVGRWGLLHTRTLKLDATGSRLEGVDRLGSAKGIVRFAWDVPFSIHFHLHPGADARVTSSAEAAELVLNNGETWRLTAAGAALSIEDCLYFAHTGGAPPPPHALLPPPSSAPSPAFLALQP